VSSHASRERQSYTCMTEPEYDMQGELDELEREDFFRLKKVQDKKERDLQKKKAEKEAIAKARAQAGANQAPVTPGAAASALPADDADLIF
jgi:V-type H+-transporting ATPase subunit D